MEVTTKNRLLDAGLAMLLAEGYNHLGIQALLEATNTPKGSFYHHFKSKEDFALQVVDRYMVSAHMGLDACLLDASIPPLRRVRNFFEATRESYRSEGLLGCLLGGLGQELSGISETFRKRIETCLGEIASRLAICLQLAIDQGDLPKGTDARHLANLLVDCWEGAALRTRLTRDAAPLGAMLDFYFQAVPRVKRSSGAPAARRRAAPRRRRS
ncbi:MAG: TetR family transcriptional regulator C-terminal domain-containing protein [Kofleriaceae bacterium]